jgi:ABC-type phosphate/phosphonate transport system substrate-binding protein
MRQNVATGLSLFATGLGLLLIGAPSRPVVAETSTRPTIRVGLISSMYRGMPEPIMQVCMKPLKSLLEEQTGLPGELVAGGDAANLARQLKEERVQLGIFHGIEFAWARQHNPALKPLVVALHHRPCLHACLVIAADSLVESSADLRGQPIALVRDSREHCRLFLDRRCVPNGARASEFFSRVASIDNAEEMLDDVVDGKYKAAVVDEVALQGFARMKPGRAGRLKTLLRSEAFPCAVIAYQPGSVDEGLLRRFRDGMVGARSTRQGQRMLTLCGITAFTEAPADYERILTDIATAYPPPPPDRGLLGGWGKSTPAVKVAP